MLVLHVRTSSQKLFVSLSLFLSSKARPHKIPKHIQACLTSKSVEIGREEYRGQTSNILAKVLDQRLFSMPPTYGEALLTCDSSVLLRKRSRQRAGPTCEPPTLIGIPEGLSVMFGSHLPSYLFQLSLHPQAPFTSCFRHFQAELAQILAYLAQKDNKATQSWYKGLCLGSLLDSSAFLPSLHLLSPQFPVGSLCSWHRNHLLRP